MDLSKSSRDRAHGVDARRVVVYRTELSTKIGSRAGEASLLKVFVSAAAEKRFEDAIARLRYGRGGVRLRAGYQTCPGAGWPGTCDGSLIQYDA